MRRTLLAVLFAVVGLVLGAGQASAQERFGGLTGVVQDASGGVLPGATISITNKDTGAVRAVVSGSDGIYIAPDLVPGRYSVKVELSGFSSIEVPDILVVLGKTLSVDAQLKVGNVSEVVNVTAEPPAIDLRSTQVAHNITAEEIDRLPKGRSFQSLALVAPSVNSGEIEGGFQVNGASGAENAFTVDGVTTNSLIDGRSRQNTVFEYLQEVQVKTTGITAEFGGALGGVISAVTKSGGNRTTGEAHYYFEGSALGAAPVKRLVLNPADDVSVGYTQDKENPDKRNEIGGSIGGALVRDRLFYFGAYSPRFESRTNRYGFSSGTEQGEIERTITRQQAFGKLTYANSKMTVHGSTLFTPTTAEGTLPTYDGVAPNALSSSLAANIPNRTRGNEIKQRNFSGTVNYTLTNQAYFSVRGGYFYDTFNDTGVPLTTNYRYQRSSVGLAGIPTGLQGPIGTQNTPRVEIANFDTTTRGLFNADYNHVFSAKGSHSLKAGFGFQRTVNDVNTAYPGGYVDIFWNDSFVFTGVPAGARGTYGFYAVNDRGVQGKAGANIMSLFVQDQWTMGRLTLSLGLRTENEKVPSFRPELRENALDFGFGDKLAPRLGFAYDLKGDGRTKIFGSWGRYFDWTKYELSRGSFGGDTWRIYYRALDTLDIASLNLGNMPGRDLWVVPGSFRDRRVPNFDTVDPLIKPMFQDSFSGGAEFQLGSSSVFTVHYVHNELRRTIEDLGALVDGNEVYYIANPGEGNATLTPTSYAPLTPAFETPKPKRQYDALELSINKRFSNNYFFSANYTLSRLYGNYAGLASSDEINTPTTNVSSATAQQSGGSIARPGGNVNRAWDSDEQQFDAYGNLDILGRLATDRPHVVKLYGSYRLPIGTQVGAFFYGGSGTPISTYVNTVHQTNLFVEGRGDMGRTPVLTRTDFLASHELNIAGAKKMRFELNVINIFNQKTARHIFNHLNRGAGAPRASSAIDLTNFDLNNGYDYRALIRATPEGQNAFDPRYGLDDLFNDGTSGFFTIKFLF